MVIASQSGVQRKWANCDLNCYGLASGEISEMPDSHIVDDTMKSLSCQRAE